MSTHSLTKVPCLVMLYPPKRAIGQNQSFMSNRRWEGSAFGGGGVLHTWLAIRFEKPNHSVRQVFSEPALCAVGRFRSLYKPTSVALEKTGSLLIRTWDSVIGDNLPISFRDLGKHPISLMASAPERVDQGQTQITQDLRTE